MRIGIGYDVHTLVTGRRLILGGQNIPFDRGLSGHSDADVLTHAVIDALLGAAGLKDIGTQFPSDNPKYKDIPSLFLLNEVKVLVEAKGFKINNIDATIAAEQPKIAPFIDLMRQRLSQTLEIELGQVMVKATTTDGLGFVGKGAGIAAYAIASLDNKGTTEVKN
ncbi:2-C-methyl-D-erythritol 2,4-cyclodiphosphate synthase [Chloroflexota bacterium]